jgi:hypothetical protein
MTTFEIIQTASYERNEERTYSSNGQSPCVRCGRAVKSEQYYVECVDGGLYALSTNEQADYEDGGYMGCFPVGSECVKHIPKEFVKKY